MPKLVVNGDIYRRIMQVSSVFQADSDQTKFHAEMRAILGPDLFHLLLENKVYIFLEPACLEPSIVWPTHRVVALDTDTTLQMVAIIGELERKPDGRRLTFLDRLRTLLGDEIVEVLMSDMEVVFITDPNNVSEPRLLDETTYKPSWYDVADSPDRTLSDICRLWAHEPDGSSRPKFAPVVKPSPGQPYVPPHRTSRRY